MQALLKLPAEWKTQNEQSSTAFLTHFQRAGFFPVIIEPNFETTSGQLSIMTERLRWNSSNGGDITSVSNSYNVEKIVSASKAFAAILADGQSSLGVTMRAAET